MRSANGDGRDREGWRTGATKWMSRKWWNIYIYILYSIRKACHFHLRFIHYNMLFIQFSVGQAEAEELFICIASVSQNVQMCSAWRWRSCIHLLPLQLYRAYFFLSFFCSFHSFGHIGRTIQWIFACQNDMYFWSKYLWWMRSKTLFFNSNFEMNWDILFIVIHKMLVPERRRWNMELHGRARLSDSRATLDNNESVQFSKECV